MADKYRIVSSAGVTKVYDPEGREMRNVKAVSIYQDSKTPIMAEITLISIQPDVDITVDFIDV